MRNLPPLITKLEEYIVAEGIKQVYVTGHSLGGAMAIKFMHDHQNGKINSKQDYDGVTYQAVTFAAPDYVDLSPFSIPYDNRLSLIEIEGDLAPDAGANFATNGPIIHFVGDETSITSFSNHSMDYYRQMVDSVDNVAWDHILNELAEDDNLQIYIGGKKVTTSSEDRFIVDGRLSGMNTEEINTEDNMLRDKLLDDFEIYYGGRGNDTLVGGSNNELMLGGSGDDTLKGEGGEDRLFGDSGNDKLYGDSSLLFSDITKLYGGLGNDTYFIKFDTDEVIENKDEGEDTVEADISYALPANVENLILTSSSKDNGIGNALVNTLTGNNENNTLRGMGGNDILYGKDGKDTLIGGIGVDQLNGGEDSDIFRFESVAEIGIGLGNRDIIKDFTHIRKNNDKIDLEMIDADTTTNKTDHFNLKKNWLGINEFTKTPGQLRYEKDNGSNFTIIEGDVTGDGNADFQIELTGIFDLDSNNFIV